MLLSAITILSSLVSLSLAIVHGVDSSTLISEATYAIAKSEGFTKAVIRAYEKACGVGGMVDPNFVLSYKNARAAGITDIDAYWLPCSGLENKCKPYATQIAEIRSTFSANEIKFGRLWIDIESDLTCQNWNYGVSENIAQAKAIVAAAKASGYNFGIYTSPGEWNSLFASYSVVIDSSLPLWFAGYDGVQSLTLETPFGGWTSAVGKQYTDVSASKEFDLDVFAN